MSCQPEATRPVPLKPRTSGLSVRYSNMFVQIECEKQGECDRH